MEAGRVAILGGGLAGMAAAVRLGEAGFQVELLESRSVLGGRASSFLPPGEQKAIDNCQHVLLGCCTNLLDFFERTGNKKNFRYYHRFDFLGPRGVCSMGASALPAPLHLLPSMLRYTHLPWPDRLAVARAMVAILMTREPIPDEPLMDWLTRHGQSQKAIDLFWRVILTSALNEDPERLSTRPTFHVFLDGFLRNRRGYHMGVPAIPLSELYGADRLAGKCRVRLSTPLARLCLEDSRVSGLELQSGERVQADYYLSALPPDTLVNLLPGAHRGKWPELEALQAVEWAPITGIHLWFDRTVMELDQAVVLGKNIQWVFNKSVNAEGDPPDGGRQYLQLVISASRSLMQLRRDEVLEMALRELGDILPRSRQAKLLNSVIVKETRSTLSFLPGMDQMRPGPQTPFPNLLLAGDWTATRWPPTMEGAVRSGYRAAESVAEMAGSPRTFLVPDLRPDFLARILQKIL